MVLIPWLLLVSSLLTIFTLLYGMYKIAYVDSCVIYSTNVYRFQILKRSVTGLIFYAFKRKEELLEQHIQQQARMIAERILQQTEYDPDYTPQPTIYH